MARCKLTKMNLRNIRKSREYQCLLIDLVKTGVVGKSAAEDLLGYTIPVGLISDTPSDTPSDDSGTGTEGDTEEITGTVTFVVHVDKDNLIETYGLHNGTSTEDILNAAHSLFDERLNQAMYQLTGTYDVATPEEGDLAYASFTPVDPQPDTLADGMYIVFGVTPVTE